MKKALLFMAGLVLALCGVIFGMHCLTPYFSDTPVSCYPDTADGVLMQTEHVIYPMDTTEVGVNITNYGEAWAVFSELAIQLEQLVEDQWRVIPRVEEEDFSYSRALYPGAPTEQLTIYFDNYKAPLTE